jgi:branched-chain amino acid transport system permease protein
MLYLQVVVNGILLGGLYAVVALGFALVWGIMNILNVAHGALVVIGAYITITLVRVGVDPFATIPAAMLVVGLIGYIIQRLFMNRIMQAGILLALIITFGLDLVLSNTALLIWSADPASAQPAYSNLVISLGPILIPVVRLLIFALAVVMIGAVFAFLNYTKTGRAIRAVALNKRAAQLTGVNLTKIHNLTSGLGGALAGGAGALVAMVYVMMPEDGGPYLTKAFIITVLSGFGNLGAVLIGGPILGIAETFGAVLIGSGFQEMVGLGLFLVMMVIRPQGLLGKKFYGEID